MCAGFFVRPENGKRPQEVVRLQPGTLSRATGTGPGEMNTTYQKPIKLIIPQMIEDTAAWLRHYRTAKLKMTQQDVANLLGVHVFTVTRMEERGARPHVIVAFDLAVRNLQAHGLDRLHQTTDPTSLRRYSEELRRRCGLRIWEQADRLCVDRMTMQTAISGLRPASPPLRVAIAGWASLQVLSSDPTSPIWTRIPRQGWRLHDARLSQRRRRESGHEEGTAHG